MGSEAATSPRPWAMSTPADDELFWDATYPRGVTIRSASKDGASYEVAKMSGVHDRTLSDAALIVRAVNSHDQLVAAIEAEAARRAYAAGLGVSEWQAFLWPEAVAALQSAEQEQTK